MAIAEHSGHLIFGEIVATNVTLEDYLDSCRESHHRKDYSESAKQPDPFQEITGDWL